MPTYIVTVDVKDGVFVARAFAARSYVDESIEGKVVEARAVVEAGGEQQGTCAYDNEAWQAAADALAAIMPEPGE